MKNKNIAYLILAGLLLITACKKGDEYFTNPNTPTTATAATMLTALEVSTINTYEGDFSRTAGIMIQHGVGIEGQATQAQVYSLAENYTDNQWGQIYQALNNGQQLRNKYGADNPYYDGITTIMMVLNWGVATDLFGDIPFTEALQGANIPFPKYDAQEVVLNSMITLLDEAIADLQKTAADNAIVPGSDDVIFGGDTDAWIKTAYTLKARYLNRFSNKGSYNPTAILAALSNGISSSADDCMGAHGLGANEQNQWYAFLNQRAYIVAAEPLVDSIKLRPADQRLFYYFDSTGFNNDVIGSPVDNTDPDVCYWGSYLAGSADTPTPLVTFFEAKFIEAEVLARQSNAGAAGALNDAIKASCVKASSGSFSGASIATYTSSSVSVSRVMYEKWIAMFGQIEAYNDYRRTRIPNLTPNASGVISVIPERFPTALSERTSNPNAQTPPLTEKVWYAKP